MNDLDYLYILHYLGLEPVPDRMHDSYFKNRAVQSGDILANILYYLKNGFIVLSIVLELSKSFPCPQYAYYFKSKVLGCC
jgi:hypothetical protein